MRKAILENVYVPSGSIVVRKLADEFLMIPITSGKDDSNDAIFSLNATGQLIWSRLNGKRSLKKVAEALSSEFSAPRETIEKDCLGLITELLKRKMLTTK